MCIVTDWVTGHERALGLPDQASGILLSYRMLSINSIIDLVFLHSRGKDGITFSYIRVVLPASAGP